MSNNNQDKFEKFLLQEYSNIAQAHFKSIENITTFFRNYLLIMSIPITSIAVASQITRDSNQLISIVQRYNVPIAILLLCIFLSGLGMFCYIINLRLDVILYARVVNGIRKYFYDVSDIDISYKLLLRVLPQSPQIPRYFEKAYFLPVTLVFGTMNTLYFSFAFFILFESYLLLSISALSCFLVHYIFYFFYSQHREMKYLKSNILGIDIDGVLNNHREQFCLFLKEKTKTEIDPEKIIIIPVHEDSNLRVTREYERKVFNNPVYWTSMNVDKDASETIRKLKNIFKFKIYIFTYRPWPDVQTKIELSKYKKSFLSLVEHLPLRDRLLRYINISKTDPLKQITKEWLKKHSFIYDRLIFEKGNDYSSDSRINFYSRFYFSKKKRIRFFVEDDLEKAEKLSYICDVVFLFSQPYNKPNEQLPPEINVRRKHLPANVIRVNSWNDIYKQIRQLS